MPRKNVLRARCHDDRKKDRPLRRRVTGRTWALSSDFFHQAMHKVTRSISYAWCSAKCATDSKAVYYIFLEVKLFALVITWLTRLCTDETFRFITSWSSMYDAHDVRHRRTNIRMVTATTRWSGDPRTLAQLRTMATLCRARRRTSCSQSYRIHYQAYD